MDQGLTLSQVQNFSPTPTEAFSLHCRRLLAYCSEIGLQFTVDEEVWELRFRLADGTSRRPQQLHLHALLVESVAAAQLEEIVAFLDKPLADVAWFILDYAPVIHWIVLSLDLEVHLLDALGFETFGGCRRWYRVFAFGVWWEVESRGIIWRLLIFEFFLARWR